MTDEAKKLAEENADLKRRVEALEAKSTPTPTDPRETERSIAEHIDRMHQMREGRMALATPPAVSRYFADGVTAADCADINRAAHAPQGPAGSAIPSSQQVSNVRTGGSATPGWVDPRPLSNPPGTNWVDAIAIADDVRQRAELKRKLGG